MNDWASETHAYLGFFVLKSLIFIFVAFIAVVSQVSSLLNFENMAYAAMKPTKAGLEEPLEQIHKIRITLSSKNVKNLEKGFFTSFTFDFDDLIVSF